ncbi:SDR family NAD(P)-dependent oxidoreductase [Candidatus Nitrosocosmicus sp. SS]|jgi:NAD(P)-dependent dehydrogenase (short-subunit alcohol dehydrogenase family)|uniref:SDR family NAD(P)-dependent oxidoreductase n=1 Tax=Candidatus Nitrosocosmicus agrestis TaxID=2563600 RepID=UPI00122DD6B3|nr:SDR family NAD(P)-dependent oxidoreductase [Candidatus Nitrosocosmicus sp. SS]KAA2282645.1 SDR family NAD(P)-dependent oxidoreductase [Candidatus Nitrosocosmicus sp. SS]KAF0867902.1 SDR family NAD(P)-dependent oxidoreductase [Candidatus Nitrosocosmicus sp. SS]MDR4491116.1 SDR family NAD(P)-dependent oxidoreductase [Candidatus Nitrosocosmicus sp.]
MVNKNKTVLVTGSGTGIGQAVARRFAKSGYNIIILGRRKEPLIEASDILNQIISQSKFDTRVKYYPGVDVSDLSGLIKMYDQIQKEFGKIDVIVNNAGVSGPVKIFTNSEFNDFKDCVSIHLGGTFWTSMKGLNVLEGSGKIITISTFFTEENKYEQRPYRFRTPYTAAQGAKNRLAECLAWELVERGIHSVATNPGPVHSDRIYKTVYPKAAAEFLRIGGFPGLTNKQIEEISTALLPFLGDDEQIIETETQKIAGKLLPIEDSMNSSQLRDLSKDLLKKIQEIAEKVQNNTKKMIVDNEFLSQEDVAEMVFNLADEKIGKMLNGKIIPNDRVFYPVKPIVERKINFDSSSNLANKVILLTSTTTDMSELEMLKELASEIVNEKPKQLIILTNQNEITKESNNLFTNFHHHSIDLGSEDAVKRIFNVIASKYGRIDSTIHFTGSYDYDQSFLKLNPAQWDKLVQNYILIPHLITRESVLSMATREAIDDPSLFKVATGNILIVGPNAPEGKKISGLVRARSEVFRGALRPYVTTANQELHDVLNSKINLTLILQGNTSGDSPQNSKLKRTLIELSSQNKSLNNLIHYLDE